MLEIPYYAALAAAIGWTLIDWRRGIYLCLIFDFLRDPIRKLAEDQPVIVTVSAIGLWMAVFAGASRILGPRLFAVVRQFPPLRNGLTLLLMGLVPAALVSTFSYVGGWKVAAIGFASYTLPLLGLVIGFHFLQRSHDLWNLFSFYVVINSLALVGTVFEFLKFDWRALGGIKMTWLRYEPGYIVELICGFYRSPDVMGLHAANVAMFATLLSLQRSTRYRWLWILLVLWGSFCLVLSGRRKMIGMMLVFTVAYVWLRLRRSGFQRVLPIMLLVTAVLATVLVLMREGKLTQDYANYAQTTVTHGGERLSHNVIGSVITSVNQSGILGSGLGTATQGSYYTQTSLVGGHSWQEDGISRIFSEMGLVGAIFAILALAQVLWTGYLALKMVPGQTEIREMQNGLVAVIAASAASFIVSHQAFSGDPCALLFISLLAGVLLSGPRQLVRECVIAEQIQAWHDRDLAEPVPSPIESA